MEDEELEKTAPADAAPTGGSTGKERPHWRKSKDGYWVICGPQDIMTPGATVEVFRKNGESATHTLSDSQEDFGQPFDSFDNPDIQMVYCYKFEEVK